MIGSSPARYKLDARLYQVYGHSMGADPLGEIKAKCGDDPEIAYMDISLKYMEEIRKNMKIFENRRTDLYETKLH